MKRGPSASLPGLTLAESCLAGDTMFDMFDMPRYAGMVTAEMASRPVPHVFEEKDVAALVHLYTEWAPHIIRWLLPQLKAPYQAYNKVSKVGWPGFFRPDNKLEFVETFMDEVLSGDLSRFDDAYIPMNVRLQVDPRGKEREFLFVSGSDNAVYNRTITSDNRQVRTPVGQRTASRTRLVFNLPVYNLIKQVLDSAIHNALLTWPAFHHDMFNNRVLPVRGYHVCLDVKHFERHTATCNRVRAAMYGGVYAKCALTTAKIPFVVPTDDWRGARKLYVDRANGYSDQYASGDSAVAPSQKEILLAIYASFFHKELGYSKEQAIQQVAMGGDRYLTIRNYGDDNSIDGDKKVVEAFIAYAGQYLHVEEEKPPKFLGFVWYPDLQAWRLPGDSYLTKNYLNERAPFTSFRKYPNMGWVEKRKVYYKLGHPSVPSKIFPAEDALIARLGIPWYEVLARADEEREQAARDARGELNPLWVMDKEYAMTAEEKLATGLYTGLTPSRTRAMIPRLLGAEHHSLINL